MHCTIIYVPTNLQAYIIVDSFIVVNLHLHIDNNRDKYYLKYVSNKTSKNISMSSY